MVKSAFDAGLALPTFDILRSFLDYEEVATLAASAPFTAPAIMILYTPSCLLNSSLVNTLQYYACSGSVWSLWHIGHSLPI